MDGANQALQGPGSVSPKENVVVGLLGGAPRAQDVGKMKDVEKMKKEELMQFAKSKLSSGVAPRDIEYVETMPKTRSGKIMRRLLKARELGLPEGDTSTLEDD